MEFTRKLKLRMIYLRGSLQRIFSGGKGHPKKRTSLYLRLFLILLFSPIIWYLLWFFGTYEYLFQTSFSYFSYPIEVDMPRLVRQVMNGETPNHDPINTPIFAPIINSADKCDQEEENVSVFLLFMVKSKVENFKEREVIRKTWGNEYQYFGVPIRTMFLLGVRQNDIMLQKQVMDEQDMYRDLIQEYFVDAYFNNTIKTMMGFKWVTKHCKNAKFVMFVDDDYFVATPKVIRYLEQKENAKDYNVNSFLIGYVWEFVIPLRHKSSKWYISLEEYPYRSWPPYPTAGSYIMTTQTVQQFYIAMQYTRSLRFDDVFIGIVAWKLHIRPEHNMNLCYYRPKEDTIEAYKDVLASHGFKDPEDLYRTWQRQLKTMKN